VIGGGFSPHGGHNLWEPLAAGVNMVLGPHHESQQYLARKLEDLGLLRVSDAPDLEALHCEPNPQAVCETFRHEERIRLHKSVENLRVRLGGFVS
jgi:3-deoxy-D-manno-octulosonic-acid transferase